MRSRCSDTVFVRYAPYEPLPYEPPVDFSDSPANSETVGAQHAPADIGHERRGYPHSRLLDGTNRSHVSPP